LDVSSGDDGATPLDEDERQALIPPHISTRAELNQWEAVNIQQAQPWALGARKSDVLSITWLKELHERMFGDTWSWAGDFRRSDKNISPHAWYEVPRLMQDLVDDTRHQVERASSGSAEDLDDLAVRFHHRLVRIHPWPNGNGRHARMATDALLRQLGRPPFTWGSSPDLVSEGDARNRYITALRAADQGDLTQLRSFVRS